ncbi:MAG: potassium-transporting ATPase subunit C [Thermoplasmata archaeon]|nr:potassium-transporting ATPase subunit C [Thermoplasmata archaeon]
MAAPEIPAPPPSKESTADGPMPILSALRPPAVVLVGLLLLSGIVYPGVVSVVAHSLVPGSADGSLLRAANGSILGSSLIGENISNPALFWPRPSMINDAAWLGAGSEIPYGPSDPNLLNETLYYASSYCSTPVLLSNGTSVGAAFSKILKDCLNATNVPIDLVSPSASGLDPSLTPAAVLAQIPRVSAASHLTESWLVDFVNAHVQSSWLGYFGPSYVNVLQLDLDLIPHLSPLVAP